VSWKDRKAVVPALRAIYRAADAEAGMKALEDFETGDWGQRYPAITQSWRRNWEHVVPFFAYPESVRRIIYTTNAIEALNSKLRRAVRTRGHFPNDDAAMKLLWLGSARGGRHAACKSGFRLRSAHLRLSQAERSRPQDECIRNRPSRGRNAPHQNKTGGRARAKAPEVIATRPIYRRPYRLVT
jgi:transposase-like protein